MILRHTNGLLGLALLAKFCVALAAGDDAAAATIEIGADQFARLGIVTGRPEPTERMTILTAPAEVVVPPMQQALLSAPVPGRLVRLYVAEGDSVASGATLAEIESPDFLQWQRDYLAAVSDNELASAQLERDRAMFEEGIVAERRFAETSARARAAQLALAQAAQQLEIAGVDAARMRRLAEGGDISPRLTVRAPLQGSILEAYADIGERVDWLDPIARVGDLSRLWLEVRVPQESVGQVRPGMTVAVNVMGREIAGEVLTIGSAVDAATQSVLVRAAADNAGDALRAGQFLPARIISPVEAGSTYAVPLAAVTRVGDSSYVFVRDDGGFSAVEVVVAATDADSAFVTGIAQTGEVAFAGIGALKALWMSAEEGE